MIDKKYIGCWILGAGCWLLFAAIAMAAPPTNPMQIFEANNAYQAAEQLQAEGKTQEALAAFEEILKKYPNTDLKNDIQMRIAQSYAQLGDDDAAIRIYLGFVSDDPNSPEASQAVSLIMNLYYDRYQFDEVIAMARQLAQQFPGSEAAAMATYRTASYLYSRELYKDAIKEYENLMEKYPNSIMRMTAFNRLIYLYTQEGLFDKAETLLKDRLDKSPKDTYMIRQLGMVYQKQGKYEQALEMYQQILKINPNDIDVYEQLGALYAEKGDKEKALAEWSKITESAPGQYSRHQLLAHILKSHGFYDQAAAEYEKAIELEPMFSYIYTQLADLYIIKKQFDSAIDVYMTALLRFPMGQSGRDEIMESMLELCELEGLYDRAISRLEVALASSPNNMQAMVTLGDIHFHKGSFGDSLYLFKKVASMYPDQGRLLMDRAQSLERETRFSDAVNYYQTVLDLFPEGPNSQYALLHIGQLKSRMKQPDSAIASLQTLAAQSRGNLGQNSYWLSAYILVGDIYLEQKRDVRTALSTYLQGRNTVENQPGGIGAYYDRILELDLKVAECYRLIGEYDNAEKILDAIQSRDQSRTTLAQVAKIRGDCFFSRGDFDKALIQYQEAVLWPMNEDWINDSLERIAMIKEYTDENAIDILKILAQVERLKKTGDYDEALKLCMSASDDGLKLEAGEILSLQKKFPEAISSYEQLVNSESKLAPEAAFRIADLYMQLNELDKAIKQYSELIEKYPDSVLVAETRKQIRLLASEKMTDKHIP